MEKLGLLFFQDRLVFVQGFFLFLFQIIVPKNLLKEKGMRTKENNDNFISAASRTFRNLGSLACRRALLYSTQRNTCNISRIPKTGSEMQEMKIVFAT